MKNEEVIFPKKVYNPFEGRNRDEVWAEIKANKKHVDKDKILAEMRQELMKRKGLTTNK